MLVAIAMGGSTNVVLHAPELARAAGLDFWREVITQEEFNRVSRALPVLVNARPFGRSSMVDIDAWGGLPTIVGELLGAGLLDGDCITCTGETLAGQVARLDPPAPDGAVIHPLSAPFKRTGGLRLLRGNLAPDGGAVIKLAGVEGGMTDGRFTGRACGCGSEAALIGALASAPERFEDRDMVVIRYEGPRGAPGMPELLDPTSRITALCRRRGITIALMTDAASPAGRWGWSSATSHPRQRWAARPRSSRTATRSSWTSTTTPSTAQNCTILRHWRRGGHGGRPKPSATAAPTRWCGQPAPGCCGACAHAPCPRSRAPDCQRPASAPA
jgi:hypothetical protein